MGEILILKHETAESARSPEMVYLRSTCRAAARRVFGRVEEVVWRPGLDEPEVPAGRPLLVIGRQDVHLGEASLERMKAALEDGAGAVLPSRLSSFDLAGDERVFTLRGFERLERRLLERTPAERSSHLPAALFSAELVAERLAGTSVKDLLTRDDLLVERGLLGECVMAGVFHDYVDYYGEVREDVLPFVPEGVRDVLEVGCGRGVTGELLKRRLGCRVVGVELNPEVAAEAAKRLDRVIAGDVLEVEIDERFDAVVATELFEHLAYPEAFLARMGELLRPGGRIVLSVPNVGHWSVVEDLLAGRFDYLPIGLLCYTHFRFFTRATLASWIERAGYDDYEIVAQTTGLPERFERFPADFDVDRENLETQGFYVVVRVSDPALGSRTRTSE